MPNFCYHYSHLSLVGDINSASNQRVREAIPAAYLQFNRKDEKSNPADMLSKYWEFESIWPLLKPLLFWNTCQLKAKTKGSDRSSALEMILILNTNGQGWLYNPHVSTGVCLAWYHL